MPGLRCIDCPYQHRVHAVYVSGLPMPDRDRSTDIRGSILCLLPRDGRHILYRSALPDTNTCRRTVERNRQLLSENRVSPFRINNGNRAKVRRIVKEQLFG